MADLRQRDRRLPRPVPEAREAPLLQLEEEEEMRRRKRKSERQRSWCGKAGKRSRRRVRLTQTTTRNPKWVKK